MPSPRQKRRFNIVLNELLEITQCIQHLIDSRLYHGYTDNLQYVYQSPSFTGDKYWKFILTKNDKKLDAHMKMIDDMFKKADEEMERNTKLLQYAISC